MINGTRESTQSWPLPARSGLLMGRSFQRINALYASQDAAGFYPHHACACLAAWEIPFWIWINVETVDSIWGSQQAAGQTGALLKLLWGHARFGLSICHGHLEHADRGATYVLCPHPKGLRVPQGARSCISQSIKHICCPHILTSHTAHFFETHNTTCPEPSHVP